MALFLSTFTNKIDKKGRVSVPAQFRSAVESTGWNGVIVFPSFVNPCIEGCDMTFMERLTEGIDEMAPFTEEYDAFSTAIFAASHQLAFDSEGRIVIPDSLISHSHLTTHATFVGRGKTFQVWEPDAFDKFNSEARETASRQRGQLRFSEGKRTGDN